MKLKAYKEYVASRRMSIHSRIDDKGYSILISDGKSGADEDHDAPHYMVYSCTRSGVYAKVVEMLFGRPIYPIVYNGDDSKNKEQ